MWSGSPVARASTKTTSERIARATSDCATRAATKRTSAPPLLGRGELVEEEVVHHRPDVPLAERLRRGVRRVQVHDGDAVVLGADPRVDVPHERVDLLAVGLAHDLRDHAVDL